MLYCNAKNESYDCAIMESYVRCRNHMITGILSACIKEHAHNAYTMSCI